VALEVTERTGLGDAERERTIEESLQELSNRPFDLVNGPLCRYRLVRLADDDHVFVQNLHHIVTDGWSSGIVNAELTLAYQALLENREPSFGRPGSTYTDHAAGQRSALQGAPLEEELGFWAAKLDGLSTLELPTDRPRPAVPGLGADSVIRPFPPELLERARAFARDNGVSLFMVLAAALNAVLSRYTGQDDIPIGVPMLGRTDEDLESVVGLFVNMVVLRSDLSGDPTFSELAARTLDANLDLYEHQDVPFHLVVDRIQPVRVPGRNPLFQVSLQLLGAANSGGALAFPGVASTAIAMASTGSRFDLAIDFVEHEDSWQVFVEYSKDLFDEWRVRALLGHLETLLSAALKEPSLRVSQLPLLGDAEREELLALGRASRPSTRASRCTSASLRSPGPPRRRSRWSAAGPS
jgi:hypothetical protein